MGDVYVRARYYIPKLTVRLTFAKKEGRKEGKEGKKEETTSGRTDGTLEIGQGSMYDFIRTLIIGGPTARV